jgi:hypothetical protein
LSASIIVASCQVGCTREVKNTPIPKGEVEINIQFTNISTAEFNVLNTIIKQLAGNHSKSLTDHSSFHGIGNDGFVYLRYRPNHPVPGPEVEEAITTRFEALLKQAKIDPSHMTLEVQYGK